MAKITFYNIDFLNPRNKDIFKGLYNDYAKNAIQNYKFESEAIDFETFFEACYSQKFFKCLVLSEESIPTGFLIYSENISDAIEISILHLISDENMEYKLTLLLQRFFAEERNKNKIISYPLLGIQDRFEDLLKRMGFNCVYNTIFEKDLKNKELLRDELREKFEVYDCTNFFCQTYKPDFFGDIVNLVLENFSKEEDAKFDPRFKTKEGVEDIVRRIVDSDYGDFLREVTSLYIENDKVVGVCFANLTTCEIANIPLVVVDREFQNRKISTKLVLKSIDKLVNQNSKISAINVTTISNNIKAIKMYENCSFAEIYRYQHLYKSNVET